MVENFKKNNPNENIKIFRNKSNKGIGFNFWETAHKASGKYYMTVSGDACLPANEIKKIVNNIGKADMILTYFRDKREIFRRIISKTFSFIINLITLNNLKYYNGPNIYLVEDIKLCHSKRCGFGYHAELISAQIRQKKTYIEIEIGPYPETSFSRSLSLRNITSVIVSIISIFVNQIMNKYSFSSDEFSSRHNSISEKDQMLMLKEIGLKSFDELIGLTLPKSISLEKELILDKPKTESEFLDHFRKVIGKNKVYKSYIGMGYYNCIIPNVIKRNILENPGWYTAYTPYQAEIAQGRLEALINFQTLITDLTAMEISNASLLDESTAASEAMTMLYRIRKGEKMKSNKFFVSDKIFPQTIELLKTRSAPLGIEIIVDNLSNFDFDEGYYGIILQYPDSEGCILDPSKIIKKSKEKNISVCVIADLMSLAILKPPGEYGADVVVGNSQRFGVPMGYGGPHAAFFATKEEFKRNIPGRIIGVSVDSSGNSSYRMALQTREQHIKREKATSNICTNQSLCALMTTVFLALVGPNGFRDLAAQNVQKSAYLMNEIANNTPHEIQFSGPRFNEFVLRIAGDPSVLCSQLQQSGISPGVQLGHFYPELGDSLLVCATEVHRREDMDAFVAGMV